MKKTFAVNLVPSVAMGLFCGWLTTPVFAASQSAQALSPISRFDKMVGASPCQEMHLKFNEKSKTELGRAFAKQLKIPKAAVDRSFFYKGWSLFYVQTYVVDPVYLFYSGNPLTNAYVGKWSGWVGEAHQAPKLKDWALKNVPGIPPELAACFAWFVTF